ncbi:MAG: hypothetical protein PHC51_00340 [bacterium]|nr:hypothetical protein [bacterium]
MDHFARDKFFRYCSAPLILLVLTTGCNKVWVNGPSLPETEMSSTGMGAAAGAVIGAGVGTIIGSTSGHAGEGLVIGSIAGAAAGGAIGRGLEGQQETQLQDTREALTRQDQVIRTQRQEIEGLRQQFDDQFSRNNRPSSYSGSAYSLNNYSGNPQARAYNEQPVSSSVVNSYADRSSGSVPFGSNGAGASFTQPRVAAVAPVLTAPRSVSFPPVTAKARLSEPVVEVPVTDMKVSNGGKAKQPLFQPKQVVNKEVSQVAAIAPKVPVVAPLATSSEAVKPRVESVSSAVSSSIPSVKPVGFGSAVTSKSVENSAPRTIPTFKTETPAPVPNVEAAKPAMETVETAIKDPGCVKADEEAGRANRATSAADKLFYYRRALRFCPSNASYHVEIGRVYQSIGREDDAEFEFQQAVNLDSGNAEAKRLLSELNG